MPADPAWGFGAGVDEGSGALEKRIWTATVCKGNKIAIKQGQTEVTHRGLGTPPPRHTQHPSLPSPLAHSLISESVSIFSNHWIYHLYVPPLQTLSISHCAHLYSFHSCCGARHRISFNRSRLDRKLPGTLKMAPKERFIQVFCTNPLLAQLLSWCPVIKIKILLWNWEPRLTSKSMETDCGMC